MGREVRRVPADWKHPKNEDKSLGGDYKPLQENYADDARKFLAIANSKSLQDAVEWFGQAPDKNDYMPDWPESERTHYMMYETTSEGTPISPAFASPEELARWLADTGASAFAGQTASYEGWLRVARGGYAPSAVYTQQTGMVSGVDGL